jgi:tRNA A37 threonylcarbamoyladenosine dehydratase
MLLGRDAVRKLAASSVIVFGVGGVGGYAVEALARSGIGRIALVDFDTVAESNINRQLIALASTVSRKKVDVEKERVLAINPEASVETYDEFFDENSKIDLTKYDYIIDAVDSVKSKIFLAEKAYELSVKIISAMSAGNRLDGTKFRVGDIYSTSVCPIARIMRRELRKAGIPSLKVVYSTEETAEIRTETDDRKKRVGSVAFVTGVEGLLLAGEVIGELARGRGTK